MPARPPRPGSSPHLGAIVDAVEPGAVKPYREKSFHERETLPPEDGPPNVRPRVPTRTGMPAPPSERRPPISNPPPAEIQDEAPPTQRERQRSRHEIVVEEGDRPSYVELQRQVQAGYGKARFVGPAWVFVLVLCVGLLVAILYFTVQHQDAIPQNAATREDIARVEAKCDALRNDLGNLAAAMNANIDREHNEMELLKLKVDVQRSK